MARSPQPIAPRWHAGRRGGGLVRSLTIAGLALAAGGTVTAAQAATTGTTGTTATAASRSGAGSGGAAMAIPAGLLLCAQHSAASKVVITRTGVPRPVMSIESPRDLPGSQPFSAVRVVRHGSQVAALARALCRLPRTPRQRMICADFLIPRGHYRLTFTVAGRTVPTVTVQKSGCQPVLGLGAVRWAVDQPGFWARLTRMSQPFIPGPIHLPVPPINPGGPIIFGPVGPGCVPASARAETWAPVRGCFGPDHPWVFQSR